MYRAIFALILFGSTAAAQERPTIGLNFNTREWSSIQYDCSLQTDGLLNCDMTQASVRKESSGKSVQEELQKAIASLKTEKPMKPEDCKAFEQFVGTPRNPSTNPSAQGAAEIQAMVPRQRDDWIKTMSAIVEFCKAPTEANAARVTTLNFEKEARTCLVSTHNFAMKFQRVDMSNTWTSNVGPSGPCGIITIGRMEQDPKNNWGWNYIQKKVITNPSATILNNLSCSGLDQAEYRYQWQSREIYAQCDYIKFGP